MGNVIESLLDNAELGEAPRETFLPNNGSVSYFYHRTNRYNVTIAYQRRGDNTVAYGASFCRPGDQFSKRRGREIALGRMHTHDNIISKPGSARWEVHESILLQLTRSDYVSYAPENFRA